MKLSVCIITLNEERDLARSLESIKKLAHEIVLIDSGSTDKTIEIAKNFEAKLYVRKFINYGAQKNYAASKAMGEWLLFLDADEEVPPELAKEIEKSIKSSKYDGYLIPRRNILLGKEIKHSRWSPDKHVWLYKRGKGKWKGEIHEEVEVDGEVGELESAKIHYSYATVTEFLNMVNSYTELTATTMVENERHFSLVRLFYDPLRSFFGRYIFKLGFLDGSEGFILSMLMAYYRTLTWLKVWEKTNVKKSQT
ncbi:glycosyltransferase family 2 protein [Patescibacteria group bacterium]